MHFAIPTRFQVTGGAKGENFLDLIKGPQTLKPRQQK
jgi:hypothetical protein